MRKFVLVLLIAAFMSVSAFAQARSGIEGVWQLTEVTTNATNKSDSGAAMPAAAMEASVTAAPAAMKSGFGSTMKATQPSMYIFTKNHYSIIYVESDKPRPVMDNYSKASQEELLSIFVEDFVANAGTYEVKAGKLTVRPMVAKSPSYMKPGTWTTSSMTIKGNEMTLVSESSNSGLIKNGTTYKLTRVE